MESDHSPAPSNDEAGKAPPLVSRIMRLTLGWSMVAAGQLFWWSGDGWETWDRPNGDPDFFRSSMLH